MIPLSAPDISEEDITAVAAVLRSGRLSLGPQQDAFEHDFAAYIGVPHAVAVSSGTSGLHLVMRALGLGPGDEVIIPSFTFIAAANSIRYEGAVPVFADIENETLNLDPDAVERAITPQTRAIVVVHTFGVPANMQRLQAIAESRGLVLIEDACEALGASWAGQQAGSFGYAGVFAFYPNKQMTTGEGGMIVTHDAALATRLRALRNHGRYTNAQLFQHAEVGFNYRLSEIACALGRSQLRRIDDILAARRAVALTYEQRLRAVQGLRLPVSTLQQGVISWFVYVIRLEHGLPSAARSRMLDHLQTAGIGCAPYFSPIHMQPAYAAWRHSAALPVTEAEAAQTIALPFFNRLTMGQVDQVCSTLEEALQTPQASG